MMPAVDPSRRRRASKSVAVAEREYCQCERRAVTQFAKLCVAKRDLARVSVDDINTALAEHGNHDSAATLAAYELFGLLWAVIDGFEKVIALAVAWQAAGDDSFANFILRAGEMLRPTREAEAKIARLYSETLSAALVSRRLH
jgi:hypothetical protein